MFRAADFHAAYSVNMVLRTVCFGSGCLKGDYLSQRRPVHPLEINEPKQLRVHKDGSLRECLCRVYCGYDGTVRSCINPGEYDSLEDVSVPQARQEVIAQGQGS